MDRNSLYEPDRGSGSLAFIRWGMLAVLSLSFLCFGCAANKELTTKKARAEAALGITLIQEDQPRAGLKHLLEAARLAPDNARIQAEVALVYRDLKQYPLSLRYFKKALDLEPDFPEAWNNLGTLYLVQRKWHKAIPCFKRAAETLTYKTPHFAYNNLGRAYFHAGEYQKAIESYREALDLAPDYSLCWDNLGVTYEATGRWRDAENAFEKAIHYAPGFPAPHFHLAKLHLKRKKVKKAQKELEETIRLAPEGPFAEEAKTILDRIH
ncbi:MAG: tetratricopeptide repeat protein [Deltaproteobacteria bacterium]|nr:tetratricopeptide repeat protein [Deltaproteobacteria bacterium]